MNSYPKMAKVLGEQHGNRSIINDRYSGHSMVAVDHNGTEIRTWETWERPNIPETTDRGVKFYRVKSSDAFRPDIVAQKALGNSKLWWWILYSNKLFDPSQLKTGLTLVIAQPPYTVSQNMRW
jgi:hypothetical protein